MGIVGACLRRFDFERILQLNFEVTAIAGARIRKAARLGLLDTLSGSYLLNNLVRT